MKSIKYDISESSLYQNAQLTAEITASQQLFTVVGRQTDQLIADLISPLLKEESYEHPHRSN
jgi:hypothetical protein